MVDADLIRITPEKEIPTTGFFKYLLDGFSTVWKCQVPLKPIAEDLNRYDRLFIGPPVWAEPLTLTILTLLPHNDFTNKKITIFACCAGSEGKMLPR